MEDTKCHCHTGKRPLVQIVEWKSKSQYKSGGQGFPFLRKHSASVVGASSSLSNTTVTGIVAVSNVSSSRRLQDLPADVFFNILLRLSVKSLMFCRCVCKIWCNIIDSPSFTNMHFTSRRVDTDEEPQLMIIYHPTTRREPRDNIRLFSLMDESIKLLRPSKFPVAEIANSNYHLVTSLCYGLFCFRSRNRGQVFLLNPLRGEVLVLPPALVIPDLDIYGVGFDCTTETYKVVHVFSRKSDFDLQQHDLGTEVYTLGMRSWRQITTVPPCYPQGRAVSAYGDVHWVGVRYLPDGSQEAMIMSFDTIKEEFKLTPHPNLPTKLFDSIHLLYLRGHLAMVDVSSMTHIEVWVLKDYDKKEWAIECQITVELLLGIPNTGFRRILLSAVICVGAWEHGLIFQIEFHNLYYYNLKTDSVKFMCIPQHIVPEYNVSILGFSRRSYSLALFGYTGSLVSLKNSGNMVAREAGLRNYFDLSTAGLASIFP